MICKNQNEFIAKFSNKIMGNIIGHHTCKNTGDGHLIIKNSAPIAKAIYDRYSSKNPFLGSGYYFWDNNLLMARLWGKKHYNNKYYIFQADINKADDILLDIVGNREHIQWFVKLMAIFADYNEGDKHWEIGKFIEFLKSFARDNDDYKDIFPFKGIKAVDNSATIPDVEYYFDGQSKSFINLNPRIIICVVEASPITLTNFKLIETR